MRWRKKYKEKILQDTKNAAFRVVDEFCVPRREN